MSLVMPVPYAAVDISPNGSTWPLLKPWCWQMLSALVKMSQCWARKAGRYPPSCPTFHRCASPTRAGVAAPRIWIPYGHGQQVSLQMQPELGLHASRLRFRRLTQGSMVKVTQRHSRIQDHQVVEAVHLLEMQDDKLVLGAGIHHEHRCQNFR